MGKNYCKMALIIKNHAYRKLAMIGFNVATFVLFYMIFILTQTKTIKEIQR